MPVEVFLPKWGLTMAEATVTEWYVSAGERVQAGQPLLCVETEKAAGDVESPAEGIVGALAYQVGDKAPVGGVLAQVFTPAEWAARPAESAPARPAAPPPSAHTPASTGSASPWLEVIPLQGLRGAVADKMTRSAAVPQVTLHAAAHVRPLLDLAQELKVRHDFEAPGLTDLLIEACAMLLTAHPHLNARLEAGEIHVSRQVNISLAVAVKGGLQVPVIKDAAARDLKSIAVERRQLTEWARAGQLRPGDLMDGTFSISNLGGYRVGAFTPLLNVPEVSLLGVGTVTEQVVAIRGEVRIEPVLELSLTFDHRAVDGATAAEFLTALCKTLEDPEALRAIP